MEKRVDARGRTGRSGQTGHGPGADGSAGMPGLDGGQIEATLSTLGPGDFQLSGVCKGKKFLLPWSARTKAVTLTARGGDGGAGGNGVRGRTGSRGSRGSDATRYSSGGNGGRGGRGGPGGDAGRGGDAGAGGRVHLNLEPENSDLLLAMRWDVAAGSPGKAGQRGAGGSGGPGGEGGDSYSWTETEYYTDSEGKRQSRTRFRRNSGGSDGPTGPSGSAGAPASNGVKANHGVFLLKVGPTTYSDRYHLSCPGFTLLSGDGDNVFEFGERGNRLRGARLLNMGAAPSPPKHTVACLKSGDLVVSAQEYHPCPPLRHSEEALLPDLTFHLKEAEEDLLPTEHEVLSREVKISPEVYFSRLDRYDPEYYAPQSLTVTFPVELKTIPSATSIAQGQVVRQEWRVVNRTNRLFPPPGRELLLDLSLLSQGADLVVQDESGAPLELTSQDALHRKLESIPPGQCARVSVLLSVPPGAKPYAGATLTASLRLTPQGGGPPRRIQSNPTRFQVSLAHQGKSSDVLLVTNHGNTAQEVESWLGLFDSLSLSWDVWDISLYGVLPLERLSELMQGKLLVLLNNSFESPDRQRVQPTEFLHLENYRRAVSEFGLSFYVIGEQTEVLDFLVPQPQEAQTYPSVTEFIKTLKSSPGVNPEVPLDFTTKLHKIGISHFFVAGRPRPEFLKLKARKLLGKLKKKWPHGRYLVTTDFNPDDNEGWLRNRNCGALLVRQMPDRDARAVVAREVYRENALSPEFILSDENLLGLFCAQDFDDKIALIATADQRPASSETLADAILMDLTEEQMDLRIANVRLSRRGRRQALNRTVEFCELDFRADSTPVDPTSSLGLVLVRVVAGLDFLSRHQTAWWDHRIRFLGGGTDVEITNLVRKLVDTFLDRNFGPDRLWGTKAPRIQVNELVAARELELEEARSTVARVAGSRLSKKATAVEALVRWELRDYLKSDASGEPELWSQQQMRALRERERHHMVRQAELCRGFASALQTVDG